MDFLVGLLNAMPGAVAQGIIWGFMAIGVYITFRILDVADLTVIDNAGDSYEKVNGERAVILAVYKSSTANTSNVFLFRLLRDCWQVWLRVCSIQSSVYLQYLREF